MKKVLALVLTVVLAVGVLTACGKKEEPKDTTADTEAVDTEGEETEDGKMTKEDGVIMFGTNAEFPPFEYVSGSGVIGEFDGIDMAIANNIATENGMTAVINNMEFDSLIIALQNGQIDAIIAGMTATEERALEVDFSVSYYVATQVMIVPEDSDITCAADLEGKNITVIQGYTGEIAVSEMDLPYQSMKKGSDAILELVNGKTDVVVIDSATATKYVNDNEGLKIVEDADAFGGEEYAIAVKKGNTALLNLINESVQKMLDDGTIAEISAEYIDAQNE